MKGIAIFFMYVSILAVIIILAPTTRSALIGITVYSIVSTAVLSLYIDSQE